MPIATDPLSLVFIGCFLFGLLFLVVSALLGNVGHGAGQGHIGHAGTTAIAHHAGSLHAGHGQSHVQATTGGNNFFSSFYAVINPMSLALFFLGFGGFGYIFHNVSLFAIPLVLLLAIISGLIIAGLILTGMNRLLSNSEASTVQDVVDRTGVLGKVSLTIPENGLGEILYVSPGGMRKSIPARSIDGKKLERDQEVVVVNYQKGIAEVDTWDHFMNSEESNDAENFYLTASENDQQLLRSLLEDSPKNDDAYSMKKDVSKE